MGQRTMSDVTGVAEALWSHDRFVVVTHENPDGDALGSLLAMTLGLRALRKAAVMYLAGAGPLPGESAFLAPVHLRRTPPSDLADGIFIAVACASGRGIGPDDPLIGGGKLVV